MTGSARTGKLMRKIIPLSEKEEFIVEKITGLLRKENKADEISLVEQSVDALHDLARSISRYPSIFGMQQLGGTSRSVETLVDSLSVQDPVDLVLHTPTKAILGRGFAVAKINLFYMLLYLSRENKKLTSMGAEIFSFISGNVYTLMAEDVFVAVLSDKDISGHIRSNAAYLLAKIWEYRMDHGVREFAPILDSMWEARNRVRPVYGTMIGMSELFSLSGTTEPVWLEFLQREDITDDELDSIREFLMGLSCEEMSYIMERMKEDGKTSLSREEVDAMMKEGKTYPDYDPEDPRELFRSFCNRRVNSGFRERAGRPGPRKTIEEYIMCYLLSRPAE